MSIENLESTIQVSKDLQKHCLSQGEAQGEDVLQLYLTLWYAWKDLDTSMLPPKAYSALFAYICPICPESKSF